MITAENAEVTAFVAMCATESTGAWIQRPLRCAHGAAHLVFASLDVLEACDATRVTGRRELSRTAAARGLALFTPPFRGQWFCGTAANVSATFCSTSAMASAVRLLA